MPTKARACTLNFAEDATRKEILDVFRGQPAWFYERVNCQNGFYFKPKSAKRPNGDKSLLSRSQIAKAHGVEGLRRMKSLKRENGALVIRPYFELANKTLTKSSKKFEKDKIKAAKKASTKAAKKASTKTAKRTSTKKAKKKKKETKTNILDGNCFNSILADDENIREFLEENDNKEDPVALRFILKIGNSYECHSVGYLRKQHSMELSGNNMNILYNMWFPCQKKNGRYLTDEDGYKLGDLRRPYVKMGSGNFHVEKPAWLYSGVPPEPRLFELVPVQKIPTMISYRYMTGQAVSGDGCNQTSPVQTYRLVPLPL
jgi:hypothetical protein